MSKLFNRIKNEYKSKDKIVLFVYLILNILVIICLINQIIQFDIKNILICILELITLLIPSIVKYKFKLKFPSLLEIIIYIFMFSAMILGEILGFYIHIKIFDIILHLLFGFVMTGIGLSLVGILNNKKNNLTPKFIILFSICYSMTSGIVWEIFEYSSDRLFKQDMQKDTIITEISSIILNDEENIKPNNIEIESVIVNNIDYIKEYGGYIDIGLYDTMKDIIVNLLGALLFGVIVYQYLMGKSKFVSNFIIKKCN